MEGIIKMEYIKQLKRSLKQYVGNNALCINGNFYTYRELAIAVSNIRNTLTIATQRQDKLIGLVTNDDLQTYASILALWLEGKAYVPINPEVPLERNLQVLSLTEATYVLDSSIASVYTDYTVLNPTVTDEVEIYVEPAVIDENDIAYILFTSGTTGQPKGVPITFSNVQALVTAIDDEPSFNLQASDRCLQMFELTFDFSVVAYLFPLLAGACFYTIPKGAIKYFYIFKLISEQKLTVLTMVPSIINYLRPYFSEINAPHVRYCSFGGGALHSDIAKEWSTCLPNSKIFNYYGPTEFTVYSGFYEYIPNSATKAYNGVIAIGTPQKNTSYLLVDQKNEEVAVGVTGELCLAGPQITNGYWKNKAKNTQSFFTRLESGVSVRYYKTGDLCIKDDEGDFLYVGRVDFQVKIRGYRVELAEIEFHARVKSDHKVAMVALAITNHLGNAELGLAIASDPFDTTTIFEHMRTQMPPYMIPMHTVFVKEFPHSINGKIDRKALKKYFDIHKD